MFGLFGRYTRWLHAGWPAGKVERLPAVRDDGSTNVPGVYVTGDLTGIPLLKLALDTGAKAVRTITAAPSFAAARARRAAGTHELVILGGGVSGMAAALEARAQGLDFVVLEAVKPFATIVDFPKGKPIYTYPREFEPAGSLAVSADVKEALVEELSEQMASAGIAPRQARATRVVPEAGALRIELDGAEPVRALRVIVAIGRSGNFRKLGVPGEDSDKVYSRLHDPAEYSGKRALVVGGGDSALETAIALTTSGADVTLSYRLPEFARAKPENIEQVENLAGEQRLRLALATAVKEIAPDSVVLTGKGGDESVPNDVVFTMIGREPPLDFFRRSGIHIRGEWRLATYLSFAAFFAFCIFLYNWKSFGEVNQAFAKNKWFPYNLESWFASLGGALGEAARTPKSFLGTLAISLREPGFYYSVAYCTAVTLFGIARIRRRRTPYVTVQTWTLIGFQLVPLFLLPYLVLPWIGHNGGFDSGLAKTVADNLFPEASYGQGREYWRSFGLILAWPLFFWNVFTSQPLAWWLVISAVQTFVIIPLIVWRWGKGAYCGWICSCGALAETLGDTHRQKMPHGPVWNRLNMTGQVILALAFLLFGVRAISWMTPTSAVGAWAGRFYDGLFLNWSVLGAQLNYYHVVDLFLAGIVGVGCYFWFSGRVWCRFACPLAALMHIYARFTRFRIFSEKKKCISCNVCTSVCHQGIDIMSFANKGRPMADVECVRCSACVQSCPTGVLTFGRIGSDGKPVLDTLAASPVQMREGK